MIFEKRRRQQIREDLEAVVKNVLKSRIKTDHIAGEAGGSF